MVTVLLQIIRLVYHSSPVPLLLNIDLVSEDESLRIIMFAGLNSSGNKYAIDSTFLRHSPKKLCLGCLLLLLCCGKYKPYSYKKKQLLG